MTSELLPMPFGYALDFELSDEALPPGPTTLDHDQLIERLRAEFGAEEIFEDPEEEDR